MAASGLGWQRLWTKIGATHGLDIIDMGRSRPFRAEGDEGLRPSLQVASGTETSFTFSQNGPLPTPFQAPHSSSVLWDWTSD